jgi:hypothetical protein
MGMKPLLCSDSPKSFLIIILHCLKSVYFTQSTTPNNKSCTYLFSKGEEEQEVREERVKVEPPFLFFFLSFDFALLSCTFLRLSGVAISFGSGLIGNEMSSLFLCPNNLRRGAKAEVVAEGVESARVGPESKLPAEEEVEDLG